MTYEIVEEISLKMEMGVEHFQENLVSIRTGRANSKMLDHVEVEYYGAMTPLNQIASISVQEGRILVVKAYDPSSLSAIEHAINLADLGIAPQNDGKLIRLTVPSLTEETRRDMCKKVSKFAEEAKVAVRNLRREANDATKKSEELTEDEQKDCLNEIQKVTDNYVKEIDKIAKAKEEEVMTI